MDYMVNILSGFYSTFRDIERILGRANGLITSGTRSQFLYH